MEKLYDGKEGMIYFDRIGGRFFLAYIEGSMPLDSFHQGHTDVAVSPPIINGQMAREFNATAQVTIANDSYLGQKGRRWFPSQAGKTQRQMAPLLKILAAV